MELIRSHDALFRFVFGEPGPVAELLKACLPAAVTAEVDWSTLRRVDGSLFDASLRSGQTDLLFEVRIAGVLTLLHLVLEHKSWIDRLAAWQLTRYVVQIIERWLAVNPEAKALPAVLPILVHHGDRRWHAPRTPRDLVDLQGCGSGVGRWLRRRQLHLPVVIFDLAGKVEADFEGMQLSAAADLTLRFLQFLRGRSASDAAERLLRWQQLLAQLIQHPRGKEVVIALFSWFLAGAPDNRDTLRNVMTKIHAENTPMRSCLDLVLELGEKRGARRARREGRLEGVRGMLEDLLQTRFGALPASVQERLAAADVTTMQDWGRRLVSALQLEDVFGPL